LSTGAIAKLAVALANLQCENGNPNGEFAPARIGENIAKDEIT
jgi:hypothetical protein